MATKTITLVHGMGMVTNNRNEFARIPGLEVIEF